MELSYTIPNEQPRHTAQELAESLGADLVLSELICWLSHSELNGFLSDFVSHLEAGDFDDLIN